MVSGFAAVLCLLYLFSSMRIGSQALDLDMFTDMFDDQYLGCVDKMEKEMPKILEEEKKYNQFSTMWNKAQSEWKNKKPNIDLPDNFKDEYGVAVVLYTMEYPHPIYKQLNGNMSKAGQSRDYYMEKFPFKALHYYLTRALQVLWKDCASQTYRGTTLGNVNVARTFRFGQFTSSSFSRNTALGFGRNPVFNISTVFGVNIIQFSDSSEEMEVLVHFAEKFNNVKKIGNTYKVSSTGELCSYYNCAYLGGEKRKQAVCNTALDMFLNSVSGNPLILCGLTAILHVMFKQF